MDHKETDVRAIIADDEEFQTALTKQIIEHLWPRSHQCRSFTDSSEALAFIRTAGRAFDPDFLITDYDMGIKRPNGFELIAAMHAAHPATMSIMITGNDHSQRLIAHAFRHFQLIAYIVKPMRIEALQRIMCECMMKRPSAPYIVSSGEKLFYKLHTEHPR
jgi:DNA-binding NtrC family response regulator